MHCVGVSMDTDSILGKAVPIWNYQGSFFLLLYAGWVQNMDDVVPV